MDEMNAYWKVLRWEPWRYSIFKLFYKLQHYRCTVDGRREFKGETLPVGTQNDILEWIKVRYRVLGVIFVLNHDYSCGNGIIFCHDSWLPSFFESSPQKVRFLVEVAEDVEKVFVLHPVPEGLLEWHLGRALTYTQAVATA